MTAFAACLLISIAWGEDYLEGGYVSSYDRSTMMDKGIAGMVQWLDAPIPSFPWYGSDLTFYRRAVPCSIFNPYREYYTTTGTSLAGGVISSPVKFDISQAMPYGVYYGNGQGLPYSQYASTMPLRTNELWISGARNWTQYAVSPVGASLQLVANVPAGGMGGFYDVVQTDAVRTEYKTYQFNPGYNTMNFKAEQMGRHMLYLVVNNQPSNMVIVDVFSRAPG
ncbi:MAG: hypothetical protein ACYDHX_09425 [Methanothrix sp.]